MNETMNIEIYFDDLKEEVQKDILESLGINDPKEMNWDVFPVATEIIIEK